ncbi:class I SAM-dependent methyltransferase [Synechococcus sp. Nb3U1]|uniref:class I SAM-dependent methyltransferase n=1 Tax=Synechococcus sp. Nb3U1 TaxID=1914529 RepID=UPI001F1D917C|nr:class I SAM-dependent methyltransferase [Synechococcus sp. Nb3U1]MCF2969987.1 class I SAM-dependent methyltransferase [Synechococcus sp. Nb3U1]
MTSSSTESLRQLYEELPYPNVPISASGRNAIDGLYRMSLTTAQYGRTRAIVPSEGSLILNAGCGSGWETLILAEANPGARLVVCDLSPESVRVTERRLRYHGFVDVELHVLNLFDLEQLGLQFDFISLNDVLYLLDDPVAGLKVLKRVLKPDGILRANLHHAYQRDVIFRMQQAFQLLGLFDLPTPEASNRVREFMLNLNSDEARVALRWNPEIYKDDTNMRANYLLPSDKGFLIPDLMRMLKEAELGLISLVDYPDWDPTLLFKEMPEWLKPELDKLSPADQNHFYELIYPNHRLIDFWAEHPGSSMVFPWSDTDWLGGTVRLNPVLADNPEFRQNFGKAYEKKVEFTMNWPGASRGRLKILPEQMTWLGSLLQGPTPVITLVEQANQAKKLEPETAQDPPVPPHLRGLKKFLTAQEQVLAYLTALEEFLFVMLDPSSK